MCHSQGDQYTDLAFDDLRRDLIADAVCWRFLRCSECALATRYAAASAGEADSKGLTFRYKIESISVLRHNNPHPKIPAWNPD